MATLAEDAVAVAKTEEAIEDPGYTGDVDNRSPRVDEYLKNADLYKDDPDKAGASWCGAFVYWCYAQAAKMHSVSNPAPRAVVGGKALIKWSQNNRNRIVFPGSDPANIELRPGDVFVVKGGSHVGMVWIPKTKTPGGFQSIEGNQTSPSEPTWGKRGIRCKQKTVSQCDLIVRFSDD